MKFFYNGWVEYAECLATANSSDFGHVIASQRAIYFRLPALLATVREEMEQEELIIL